MAKKKKKTVKVSRKKGKVKVIKGKNVLWKKASFNSSKKKVSQPGKVISSFGGIRFFVTKNTALIIDNLKQEVSGRWSEHEIIGKKPKSEFTGADLRSFSFEIMVDINLGYKPHSILKKLHRLVERGKVDTLMIGTHKIGSKWKMTNASDSFDVVYAGGELAKASISVTLKEY